MQQCPVSCLFVFNIHAIHKNIHVRQQHQSGREWNIVRIVRILSSRGVLSPLLDWTTNPSTSGSLQFCGPMYQIWGAGESPWHCAGQAACDSPCLQSVPGACACHTAQCRVYPRCIVVWDKIQPIPLRPGMQPPLSKLFIFKLWAVLLMPDLGSWAHTEREQSYYSLEKRCNKERQVQHVQLSKC